MAKKRKPDADAEAATSRKPPAYRRSDAQARMAAGLEDLIAGKSHSEIARIHGVSRRVVRRWASEPAVREALDTAQAEALDVLRGAGAKAAATLTELLASDDERIRLSTATSVLDRIGVIKSEGRQVEVVNAPKTVEEARQRLAAMAAVIGAAESDDDDDDEGDE